MESLLVLLSCMALLLLAPISVSSDTVSLSVMRYKSSSPVSSVCKGGSKLPVFTASNGNSAVTMPSDDDGESDPLTFSAPQPKASYFYVGPSTSLKGSKCAAISAIFSYDAQANSLTQVTSLPDYAAYTAQAVPLSNSFGDASSTISMSVVNSLSPNRNLDLVGSPLNSPVPYNSFQSPYMFSANGQQFQSTITSTSPIPASISALVDDYISTLPSDNKLKSAVVYSVADSTATVYYTLFRKKRGNGNNTPLTVIFLLQSQFDINAPTSRKLLSLSTDSLVTAMDCFLVCNPSCHWVC